MVNTADEPYLVVANSHYIRKVNFLGSQKILKANLVNAVAIGFDYLNTSIYWTDITNHNSGIYRMNVSKTNATTEVC